jgi:hypothetical protein
VRLVKERRQEARTVAVLGPFSTPARRWSCALLCVDNRLNLSGLANGEGSLLSVK